MDKIINYIKTNWDNTIRKVDDPNLDKTLLPLPYPYTVPCMDNMFQEMYYWDTFFTNRGLLLSGRSDMVFNNIKNFMYLLDTYGYIPNGSRTHFLNRSQPPFLGLMVSEYYQHTRDKEFLKEAYRSLCIEYDFWMKTRCSSNGLNHYSAHNAEGIYPGYVEMYKGRTGIPLEGDVAYWGRHVVAEAESGWDFNPRFYSRCADFNPVDLNSLLYFNEILLGKIKSLLQIEDDFSWEEKAEKRKQLMIEKMRDEEGTFYDYDYVNDCKSDIVSCAAFFPYFTGMIEDDRGIDILLEKLELPYGLQAAQKTEGPGNFQWGQNNGWPCMQLVAAEALEKAGRQEDGDRVKKKYITVVEKSFEETGSIWEKYNIVTGDNNAVGEYGTPTMMGWSAGVYLSFKNK